MADPTARELKLIQYLNEAYGKEKQLETTLQAQIKLATPEKTLKKRLQDHLKETKAQSRNIERRVKALGGKAEAVSLPGPDVASNVAGKAASVANKALAAAKAPVMAIGTSPQEVLLRNVRDAYWNEAEEIAHYDVIEAAANALADKDTAKLAKEHRRQEERMQQFLGKQIDKLVKSVIRAEVPARDRKPATARASSSRSTSRSTRRRTTRASSTRSAGSAARSSRAKASGSSNGASASKSPARTARSRTRAAKS